MCTENGWNRPIDNELWDITYFMPNHFDLTSASNIIRSFQP